MSNKSVLIQLTGGDLETLIFDCVDRAIKLNTQSLARTPATDAAPFMSSDQVKKMTGWPDGTFYLKVGQMPEGVVIRGKSKRLLFDRTKFIAWLTDAEDADALPFGPTPKTKRRADV